MKTNDYYFWYEQIRIFLLWLSAVEIWTNVRFVSNIIIKRVICNSNDDKYNYFRTIASTYFVFSTTVERFQLHLYFFSKLVLGTQLAAGVTYIIINLMEYPTGAAYDA